MQKLKTLKCAKCKGTPDQHNIRDAEIHVPETNADGEIIGWETYPQHSFRLTLAVAGS